MSFFIGLDIGGTKIAGALFAENGDIISQKILPTPKNYSELVSTCGKIVECLEDNKNIHHSVGVGVPGAIDYGTGIIPFTGNTPCLNGKHLQKDLEAILNRPIRLANDADCAALSEATDGAAKECRTVFGLIMGTGVGGGFIVDKKIVASANGLIGEFGHITLPFREMSDGPLAECICTQKGCIDKSISGLALARLYQAMTDKTADAVQIAELANQNNSEALHVLDLFYTTVAKAMMVIIHTFDPDIITVSGGLYQLPNMYEAVTRRWGKYTICKQPKTKFVPAKHGAMTGLRGAAWVGKT